MKSEQLMALTGENAKLLDELYEQYKQNSNSVSSEWKMFFQEMETSGFQNGNNGHYNGKLLETGNANLVDESTNLSFTLMAVSNILNAYRRQGHLAANLDPLEINKPDRKFIDNKINNLTQQELNLEIDTGIQGIGKAKLKEVIDLFEKIYCSTIGAEHYYLVNEEERTWLQERLETPSNNGKLNKSQQLRLFEKLCQADFFESFLAKKYVGKKRFSLEGGESLIPLLDTIIEESGVHNLDCLVIGMAHRGRLNVLVNTIKKPAGLIFAEFEEKSGPNSFSYGDVKYHLGYSNKVKTSSGKEIALSLAFNPSHLEAVNPVVTGSVRARQELNEDKDRSRFMPILIHGDAAFAGQGVIPETINLMNLEGYTTGGTFHIVINNQIGFTTLPQESRSTLYSTDLAKGFQIPIFHVNADDPDAVFKVVKLGMEYRQKFKKDFIMDLVCYRKLGHNETDEPAFTQPFMYKIIRSHEPVVSIYEKKLLKESGITQSEIDQIKNTVMNDLEVSFKDAKENDVTMQVDTMKGVWSKYSREELDSKPATKLLKTQIARMIDPLTTTPNSFTPNPKLVKLLENRREMALGNVPIDWGFAEALSFGSILENGVKIRLSGQDSQRGTFSHRHAVLVDINNGSKYVPLNHISSNQAKIEVVNSSLSEYSVLGFEYGYSLSDPNSLVIWEAQFGDFANNAQVIFDQFIASSEVKWHRMSGLTVLLPHGYEGQGPEHSSGRLERFLQLSSQNNIQVCNCTNAAQYFHLLRRQILRNFRKPLIVMTPKSLLRFPKALSNLDEILQGTFKEVIVEENEVKNGKIERVIFCSGKVYYDLENYKEVNKLENVSLIRLEQLYPLPEEKIKEIISLGKKSVKKYIWCQEEPKNQGAWSYINERFQEVIPDVRFIYAGRLRSPSPAAGHMKVHNQEQEQLVKDAYTL